MVLEEIFSLLLHFLPIHHPSTHISTRPYSFLPVQMMGGWVDGSLHKAMQLSNFPCFHYKKNLNRKVNSKSRKRTRLAAILIIARRSYC